MVACGAPSQRGACRRPPVPGGSRCRLHGGVPVPSGRYVAASKREAARIEFERQVAAGEVVIRRATAADFRRLDEAIARKRVAPPGLVEAPADG